MVLQPSGRAPLVVRRPKDAAVGAAVVYSTGLLLWLLLPWDAGTGSGSGWVVLLGIDLTRLVVAVVLLTALGLWRAAGFTTRSTWRSLLLVLPLLVFPALPTLFGPGLADRAPWAFGVAAFSTATVAFGEEAVFRGVVLRALLPRSVRVAVLGSAALFGLMHLINLATGGHPVTVGAQVLMTFGVGIGFGAVALATGTIWPLVAVHFAMDYVNVIQAAVPTAVSDGSTADVLANAAINLALGAVAAGYGGWLLHRRVGLIRDLEATAQR